MRLDSRDKFPSCMEEYLSKYGWHFSKKMCDWACNKMRKGNSKVAIYSKDEVDAILQRNNIVLDNNEGYDSVYVANMCKADYYGSSIMNENQLAKFIKDYLDDTDGYPEIAFTRFYADTIGKGVPIIWEDVV